MWAVTNMCATGSLRPSSKTQRATVGGSNRLSTNERMGSVQRIRPDASAAARHSQQAGTSPVCLEISSRQNLMTRTFHISPAVPASPVRNTLGTTWRQMGHYCFETFESCTIRNT
ncbi:unnamed protein product [Lota lota]